MIRSQLEYWIWRRLQIGLVFGSLLSSPHLLSVDWLWLGGEGSPTRRSLIFANTGSNILYTTYGEPACDYRTNGWT